MSDAALADDHQSRRVERKSGQTPEQEIEQARQSLARKDDENKELRRNNEELAGRVAATGKAAADAEVARISERESSLTTAISSARSSKEAATAAKRSARANGDIEAELAADDQLTAASVRLEALNIEKSHFDSQKPVLLENAKKRAEAPLPTGAAKPSADSQKWLDDHPLYFSDPVYKADAIEAHEAAIRSGTPSGSPAYIEIINTRLARIHGADHGRTKSADGGQQRQVDQHRGASSATPPGRDTDSAFSTSVDGSTLRLGRNAEGKEVLTGTIPSAWRDGAKWTGMDEVAYAIEQMHIIQEQKEGRSPGVQMGDGMIYR